MADDRDERSLAEEYLEHESMEETAAYLQRGRAFRSLRPAELEDQWTAAFRTWFENRYSKDSSSRVMDDLAAELRLQGLEPPLHRVKAEADELRAEISKLEPGVQSALLEDKIDRFLESREKPKH